MPAVARIALVACALASCKGRREASPPDPVPAGDAAAPDANLAACRAAAAGVPSLPPARRAQALLDACQPCGPWQTLLDWNTPPASGGPSRAAIEQRMIACDAFCEPNARQRFLAVLDQTRGQPTRGPWRHLGEMCKTQVSAVPDARFMGAPYFALDRIARALGRTGDLAVLRIEVPLPALSLSGVGMELPEAPRVDPDAGPDVLSVDSADILLGALPSARLSDTGLAVSGNYPGAVIAPDRLAARLAAPPAEGAVRRPIVVLAPRALAAVRIAQVVAAAGGQDLRLAAAIAGPGGWIVPGAVPVALAGRPAGGVRLALGASSDAAIAAARAASRSDLHRAPPTIEVDAAATAGGLAGLLGTLATLDVTTAAVVAAPAAVPKP
jgi:hypothetical protein